MSSTREGRFRLELDAYETILGRRSLNEGDKAQQYVDSTVLRLCAPMVPFDSGELMWSGIRETRIGSGEVVYQTPYARRWYYEPANFFGAPTRGNYWFERMKNNGGAQTIMRGLAEITGGKTR